MADNCAIWSENDDSDDDLGIPTSGPCFVHAFEREQLGIGGKFTVQGHTFMNFLLLIDGEVENKLTGESRADGGFAGISMKGVFHEKGRRGQRIDLGGYYLDPKPLEPGMSPVGDLPGDN